jgi:hypothetical protein
LYFFLIGSVLVLGPGKKRMLVGGDFSRGRLEEDDVRREKEKKGQHLL